MKKIMISFICLICLAFSTAFATEFKPYENTSGRYSIDVPTDFAMEPAQGITQMVAVNKETGALMSVKVNVMKNGMSQSQQEDQLKQALPILVNRLKSQGATIMQSRETTVSGCKAICFAYTVERGGVSRYQEQYMILNKGALYNVTFTALSGTGSLYQPVFNHAIRSMVLK